MLPNRMAGMLGIRTSLVLENRRPRAHLLVAAITTRRSFPSDPSPHLTAEAGPVGAGGPSAAVGRRRGRETEEMNHKLDTTLVRFVEEAKRFPMLSPEREQELARAWREPGGSRGAEASWSAAICASSSRSPAASPAMACRSPTSSPKAMSA